MHLASYRGNMDAIKTLILHGADQHAENYFGLNMVHVAA
jgi:ankyrin repeat protein